MTKQRNAFRTTAAAALVAACLCGAPTLMAQTPAAPAPAASTETGKPAAQQRVEEKTTLWMIIKSGGWAMWPLGACSVATVALTLLNVARVNRRGMLPAGLIARARAAARSGDANQCWTLANASNSFFGRVLVAGLRHIQPYDPPAGRKKMEEAIAETASREESQYGFFVNFLALLTSMSPMWGLLGTVSGMIGAFSKIGEGGMGKPEMLAKNIGEALVCTASGLIIAIASMGFYFFFRNTLNSVIKESEAHFTEILDSLTGVRSVFDGGYAAPAPAAEGYPGQAPGTEGDAGQAPAESA